MKTALIEGESTLDCAVYLFILFLLISKKNEELGNESDARMESGKGQNSLFLGLPLIPRAPHVLLGSSRSFPAALPDSRPESSTLKSE